MRLILVLHCIVLWEVFVIVSPIIIARLVVIVVYSLFSLFATPARGGHQRRSLTLLTGPKYLLPVRQTTGNRGQR